MRTNDWVGKRKAARQPVNMRGEIRFLDNRAPLEVRITDISASGCAIELKEDAELPEDFDLFIESRGETKICKVRRNAGLKLGLAFLKSRLDDPLVMQTLLERVQRLERGYAELKGQPVSEAVSTAERRAAGEPRRADDREVAVAGPSIDQRIQALAAGLSDARATIDRLISEPRPEPLADLTPKVDAQSRDIAGLKMEMAQLAKVMRGMANAAASAPASPGPVADHSADIAELKQEMTRLSVSMRDIAATPALQNRHSAPAAAQSSEAFTRDIAKIRAELSEVRATQDALRTEIQSDSAGDARSLQARLRADLADLQSALQVIREAPGTPGAPVERTEFIKARVDIARLREDFEGALASVPQERLLEFANGIGSLRAEVGELREQMKVLGGMAAGSKVAPRSLDAALPADHADIAALRADIDELRARVKDIGGLPAGVSPAADPTLAGQIEELRGAIKTLIMLVSRTLNRLPDAA